MLAMLCVGIALTVTDGNAAVSINKKHLVGNWTLVSITNTLPDGKKAVGFGANEGVMIFGADGKFVQALVRSDIPKFASSNRNNGSPDENQAVVQKSLVFFGTYTVSNDGTLMLHIKNSSFSNWNGTDQKRMITSLTANELQWHNPAATVGGTTETVWKHTK
jgi:hypothetical protein